MFFYSRMFYKWNVKKSLGNSSFETFDILSVALVLLLIGKYELALRLWGIFVSRSMIQTLESMHGLSYLQVFSCYCLLAKCMQLKKMRAISFPRTVWEVWIVPTEMKAKYLVTTNTCKLGRRRDTFLYLLIEIGALSYFAQLIAWNAFMFAD